MEDKKIIIFYYSYSAMSTEKLVKGIQSIYPNIEILLLPSEEKNDVSSYDYVGFASGIYITGMGEPIFKKIEALQGLEGKKCFSLCTSGRNVSRYPYYPKKALEQKGAKYLGGYGCHGKVNYFPFSAFGGVNKDKPDENDIKNGAEFLKKLVEENP